MRNKRLYEKKPLGIIRRSNVVCRIPKCPYNGVGVFGVSEFHVISLHWETRRARTMILGIFPENHAHLGRAVPVYYPDSESFLELF